MTIEAIEETFEVYDIANQRSWFVTTDGVDLDNDLAQSILDNFPDLAQQQV